MKYIILLFLSAVALTATSYAKPISDTLPSPVGYVNDFARILSSGETQLLDSLLSDFEQRTTNGIAVVTIDSLNGALIEDYSLILFNTWGLGTKEKNNGVLLLFSMKERRVRISTGTGIEQILTDADCKKIIDTLIIPNFKNTQYFEGIKAAVDDIMLRLK